MPRFTRRINDWEVEIVVSLLRRIQGWGVNNEDRLVWDEGKEDVFSVKSLYLALERGSEIHFPAKVIRNPWVPTKVSFFAWEASWG